MILDEWLAPLRLLFRRLILHYGIYRRYPLGPFSAFKNAWRIARR